jgi:hypothetical protein
LNLHSRYELVAYRENTGAGEEVDIAVRSWHPDLRDLTEDFVLFDHRTDHAAVVWMRYDDQGQLAELAYSERSADLALAAAYILNFRIAAVPACCRFPNTPVGCSQPGTQRDGRT